MRSTSFRLAAACTVALLLTACDSGASAPDAPTTQDTTAASQQAGETATTTAPSQTDGAGGTAYPTSAASTTEATGTAALTDDQILATLRAMGSALETGDVEAFLEHVDPAIAEEQRAWFEAVRAVPMDVRQLRLDGVVSRTGPEGTVAHVGLRHQVSGGDPVPLIEQYRWVFAEGQDGAVRLTAGTGRTGAFYGYPQVWDSAGPVSVIEGHSVLLLAPQALATEAEGLLDTLDLAAERSLEGLPWAAEGRELVVVNLAEAALVEEVSGYPDAVFGQQLLVESPEEIPWDASRLSPARAPVAGRILLDLDAAVADVEEFGPSPGGHTALRYMVAYNALWGDDAYLWPEDWILEGVSQWWSALEDPPYLETLRGFAAGHHQLVGEPTDLPEAPFDDDPVAFEDYSAASISLALYLAETYGDEALIDLAGRLAVLDQRHDRAEIEEAYAAALGVGVGQEQVLTGWAAWAVELADGYEPMPASEET